LDGDITKSTGDGMEAVGPIVAAALIDVAGIRAVLLIDWRHS